MNDCDTLLMIGSGFPYSEFLPAEGQARGVQIDIDARMMSLRYPMEHCLLGDSAATLRALLPLLQRKTDRTWRDKIEAEVAKWWEILESRAMADASPINPQRVYWELSPRLPEDAILSFDSGSGASWLARDVKLRRGMMCSVSGGLASMGCGVPYALAAKLAHPTRPVIALVGDGAMQMLGINALITVSKEWRQWADPRLIIMVLNNGDLNMVTWEQRITEGAPKFSASQDLPAFDYAAYARMLGLGGIRVTRPEDVALAWDAALVAPMPTVLDMVVDPDVPPLPPHVAPKQAKAFLSALLHRDPDAIDVVKQTARQWWESHFTKT
jgi:pyruvate dehydrogenase (quinone)